MPLLLGSAPNQVSVNSDLGTAAFIDAKQLPVSGPQALAIAAASTPPGGATNQVQYNNAGAFAGSANLTFNGTTFTAVNDAVVNGLTVGKGTGGIGNNTAIGSSALNSNTTGNHNTASGYEAMRYNTTGFFNAASGSRAMRYNTTGSYNTASGYEALSFNTTGGSNTAIGSSALTANTTGGSNTAIGSSALTANTTGSSNTANGFDALTANTTGSSNTAIGMGALRSNTTGAGNTTLNPRSSGGFNAPVFNPTIESDRFCMGSTTVTNAYIQVAWTVVSDARDKTDFAPVPHGLDFVRQLKPTAYRYTMTRGDAEGHGPVRYGFKAQEVLALEGETPVIVDAEDADKLRFNDQSMIAVLVNAIQELNAKFDAYVVSHP
jgi:hypothetical protein